MVMDKGLGMTAFHDLLNLASPYIDFVKMGFGTLCLTPQSIVEQKVLVAKEHRVALYPGGTCFEWFAAKGKWEWYLQQLVKLKFTWVEISDGVISLDRATRTQMIQTAHSLGLQVLTEIGKKEAGVTIPIPKLIAEYEADLAAGAAYVIVEGREMGEDIGIYNKEGDLDQDYVSAVSRTVNSKRLIWEAPKKKQQVALIRLLGTSVNLGNISTTDILSVESLRRGLRADTFDQKME